MAAQAIAGMVAMTASSWVSGFRETTYAKEKLTSIGINAGQLVLIATQLLLAWGGFVPAFSRF